MAPFGSSQLCRRFASYGSFLFLLWLVHALAYCLHEYAHSFTAWALGWKANPLALSYGSLDWNNILTQADVDENVNYAPIFAAGRGAIASLIAVAGVLLGNGVFYLVSLCGYRRAKIAGRTGLALFFFLLCVMNVGNLISYVPARTFATHADMATVERGLQISPWWIAMILGIPFCGVTAYFVLRVVPQAMCFFFPKESVERSLLLSLVCGMIFVFYGGAGLNHYGSISHGISLVSMDVLFPLATFYTWRQAKAVAQ